VAQDQHFADSQNGAVKGRVTRTRETRSREIIRVVHSRRAHGVGSEPRRKSFGKDEVRSADGSRSRSVDTVITQFVARSKG
jgi:hypothetical protein